MTLAEFLLARIADDAAAVGDFIATWQGGDAYLSRLDSHLIVDDEYASIFIEPSRICAECESKRRIVKWVQDWPLRPSRPSSVDGVLEILALPYADHPDYQESWRP